MQLSAKAALLIALTLPFVAHAHSTSTAYLEVDTTAASAPTLQWRIALRDLDALLNLDANGDDQLTWGEVADRAADVTALAASKLVVKADGAACTLRFESPQYVRLADAGYAQLNGAAACSAGKASSIEYRLFEGVDPSHRVIVSMQGSVQPRIVAPGSAIDISPSSTAQDAPSGFGGFFSSGIAHIAGGIDHVLFLLTLLLPAVLVRREGRWVARDDVQGALWNVIWIATAFTIAHSITLALATFDVI
ncbi:MAG: HupE/UreJ family protein, partial [Burkholderiaceae bacterium]